MKEKLTSMREAALTQIAAAPDLAALENLRVGYLGKKGELTAVLKQLGGLEAEARKEIGALANLIREDIGSAIEQRREALETKRLNERLLSERIDVSAPGRAALLGGKHPITKVLDELKDIFLGMGFSIAEGPEVESDYYNFEALNMPKNHPSRDTQDTFYISDNVVLRSQTSPVQIRTMEAQRPPIRIIAPGKVYRSDEVDATHSPVFHQVEGLVVDKNITMSDLKGTLDTFARRLYGEDTVTRFRPHHFQFTEPSAEMDMMCFNCHGAGCRMCKGEGWIELLGGGMVHPKVLSICGIDPNEYSGFAFGLGLDRLAMRKYQIDDLRLLFENDLRFLSQF